MSIKYKFQELLSFSIINIDKPSGPTSFQVSQYVKNQLKINKTSHFGTLDPQVSGVLPVALGRACRLSDFFMHKDKTYVGIMQLHNVIPEEKIFEVIKDFTGVISQLPPKKSRVKRAYREREIKTFKILEINNKDVLFETQVQAGTYIRKLIHDIGEKIGGAHMLELRRTQASIFSEKDSVTLYELENSINEFNKGNLKPLSIILNPAQKTLKENLKFYIPKSHSVTGLYKGKPLMIKDINKNPEDEIFALEFKKKLIGIYKKTDEGDIIARPKFVYN